MLDWSTLTIFFVAAAALLITPGPAVLYIVARSVDQGRRAGIVSTLGIAAGTLFHIAAAALGVSAILMTSALAFNVVKYLGAAYLIYLGVRKLTEKEAPQKEITVERQPLSKIFYEGVVVNLLNPKTALFFFAFLPQFVDPARGSATIQVLLLSAIFVTMALCSDGTYAILAGTAGKWLKQNAHFLRFQRYVAGSIYIFLGITAALSGGIRSK
ncbi:MAG: LysE family translocator [Anaerolineales bacterium]|nr:LysE family translocator [Anaerolineales bacterium]